MRYSDFTQRIAGDGAAAWDIHYRALARVEQGEEILLLSVGDPDFDTPAPIVQSAIDSLLAGNTHYADVRGKRALRQRIAERHRQRSGQAVDAEQVVVLAGAQCALYAVVQCLLNPGDEVIVAEPMYVTYEAVFGACGARVVPVPVRSENGFRVQAEEVAALITPRTRAMALNSPHNPSGASLPRATWEALAELCMAHDLWMISDEVYSELLFDGEHVSPASLPGMADRTATLNSLSKSHAMTGWRAGYLVGDPSVINEIKKIHQLAVVSGVSFVMEACITALREDTGAMREEYRARRDYVCSRLDEIGLPYERPQGAFYVFPSIKRFNIPSEEFCTRLIDEAGLCLVPGSCFGRDGYVRISYCYSRHDLEAGLDRLAKFISSL